MSGSQHHKKIYSYPWKIARLSVRQFATLE